MTFKITATEKQLILKRRSALAASEPSAIIKAAQSVAESMGYEVQDAGGNKKTRFGIHCDHDDKRNYLSDAAKMLKSAVGKVGKLKTVTAHRGDQVSAIYLDKSEVTLVVVTGEYADVTIWATVGMTNIYPFSVLRQTLQIINK